MNLQQLHYLVALDEHRQFARAADACHVTQPTLSMMLHKLEEELGLALFHRRPQLAPTAEGQVVLTHARSILAEVARLTAYAQQQTQDLSGTLHLGVIPTVAPTLLPGLLAATATHLPDLHLVVRELLTDDLLASLHAGHLDIGIVATPVDDPRLQTAALYQEPFLLYSPTPLPNPRPQDLGRLPLWLLDEGHCFRDQVLSLCSQPSASPSGTQYRSGTFQTLVALVDRLGGATVLPAGITPLLTEAQQARLQPFAGPAPRRTIQAVTAATWPRTRLRKALLDLLRQHAPVGTVGV